MNQSTLIGGALIFTFLLFLASRNRLGLYGNVLWGNQASAASVAPSSSAGAPATAGTAAPAAAVSSATPSTSAATAGTASPATTPVTVAPASQPGAAPVAASTAQTATQKLMAAFSSNSQSYASSLNNAAQLAAAAGMFGF